MFWTACTHSEEKPKGHSLPRKPCDVRRAQGTCCFSAFQIFPSGLFLVQNLRKLKKPPGLHDFFNRCQCCWDEKHWICLHLTFRNVRTTALFRKTKLTEILLFGHFHSEEKSKAWSFLRKPCVVMTSQGTCCFSAFQIFRRTLSFAKFNEAGEAFRTSWLLQQISMLLRGETMFMDLTCFNFFKILMKLRLNKLFRNAQRLTSSSKQEFWQLHVCRLSSRQNGCRLNPHFNLKKNGFLNILQTTELCEFSSPKDDQGIKNILFFSKKSKIFKKRACGEYVHPYGTSQKLWLQVHWWKTVKFRISA